MSVAIITGSAGLIGSEAARYFAGQGMDVVGVDNDMRERCFGPEASTLGQRALQAEVAAMATPPKPTFATTTRSTGCSALRHGTFELVVHTAAQPSHDWAAREPKTDFAVNANGTLNLLEATPAVRPDAVFIFTSTNKVYGDTPNRLPLVELELALGDRARPRLRRAAFARTCRSTTRCTACSAPRRWRPTCWCRSMAATSGCGPRAFAAAA